MKMKYNFLFFISILLFCMESHAQIKIRDINQQNEKYYKRPLVQLDSTKNITIYPDVQNSSQYIGSKIIFCPLSENSSTYSTCFDLYYYSGTNIEFVLNLDNRVSRYRIDSKVLSIDSLLVYNNKSSKKSYYILSDVDKNRYLWDISSSKTGTRDALLISYLNYVSQKYVGVKYTANKNLRNTETNWIYDLTNIETGEEEAVIKSGDVFICTGVEFVKANYTTPLLNPFLILKNNNTTIRVSFMHKLLGAHFNSNETYFRPNIQKDFISIKNLNLYKTQQKERMKYIKDKYGEDVYTLITNKEVKIGMTKEACLESWGKPKYINNTITSDGSLEQWVYGSGNYLYFVNGTLKTIQNTH